MHILVPRLGLVLLAERVECLIAFFTARLDNVLAGVSQFEGFLRINSCVMVQIHVERNALLIFFEDCDRESEAHDREVHRLAIRCKRHDPSSLTPSLIADAPETASGEPLCLPHGGDRVSSEKVKILCVGSSGHTSPALVI